MVLYNKDGTVYKPVGELSQLVPDSPSHELFDKWDQEIIRAGGTPLLYYEVFIPTNNVDPIYMESRDKLWSQQPIELWGVYDPIPSQLDQGLFGIDGPDTMIFYTNYKYTIDAVGHLPNVGARIFTPHLKENWEIVDRKLNDFHRWKVYRIEIHCQRFQESYTTGEGKVSQDDDPTPSFGID